MATINQAINLENQWLINHSSMDSINIKTDTHLDNPQNLNHNSILLVPLWNIDTILISP